MATVAPVDPAAANVVTPAPRFRGLEVHLQPFARVPDATNGKAPRLNFMTTQGGDLFVAEEHDGHIYRISGDRADPKVELWFDVGAAIAANTNRQLDTSNPFHGGLRAIAFHPDFETNGRFYTSAMETRPTGGNHTYLSDVANPVAADSVLLEWRANPGTGAVDTGSYREVFRVGMPVYDHPIKAIAFNQFAAKGDADYGLLYIGHGDASVESAVAGGGQRNDALGKILRINPLPSGGASYSVPRSNPFVGNPSMLNEVYSLGHRNPHQLSFAQSSDGASTVLLASDAGRDNAEEVNIIKPGADYGWPQREGTFVHLAEGGVDTGVAALPGDDWRNHFTYPVAQVGHDGAAGASFVAQSIAGGYVTFNGSPLSGQYVYADFPVSGKLFHSSLAKMEAATTNLANGQGPGALSQAPTGLARIFYDHDKNPATPALPRDSLTDVFNDSPDYETQRADVRFGQGPAGELYVMSKRNNTIYLVTSSLPGGPGGFSYSRNSFACSVQLIWGGHDVRWINAPDDATRMVIKRKARNKLHWRGRAEPATGFFRDDGLLPAKSARFDFVVEARNSAGKVIASTECLAVNTPGLGCTVARSGNRFHIDYDNQPRLGQRVATEVVARRQIDDEGPFWWRGRTSNAPFVDNATSREVNYQILARDSRGVIIGVAACRIPGS